MKLPINNLLNASGEYVFARLAREAKAVEEKTGRKILNLGPGSPDVPPSKQNIAALTGFLSEPAMHMYPGYLATQELAQALIDWHRNRFGIALSSDEVMPLLGAKDGVAHLPMALLNPGDEVLVPDPGYPAYIMPTRLAGGIPVPYPLLSQNDFRLKLPDIETLITDRTKYIWVNFPSNPTGQVATRTELKELVALGKKHNLVIIYDHAYSEITFDGYVSPSILEIEGARELTIEIGSFSKSFSLAGFRMGWIVGNRDLIANILKLKSQVDSGLALPLQKLGAFALNNPDKAWQKMMLTDYQNRRDILAEKLTSLGLTLSLAKGSLYIWARIPADYASSERFCEKLLQERQVLLTPGSAFGENGEGFVRVSICSDISQINNYL